MVNYFLVLFNSQPYDEKKPSFGAFMLMLGSDNFDGVCNMEVAVAAAAGCDAGCGLGCCFGTRPGSDICSVLSWPPATTIRLFAKTTAT
mmetsp:Transcript_13149/g.17303  ORF Transcript_13149/g.17303 Transcript_13149/m.17303 type:complete len:89 (-) Transcript_13149:197-463(-)